MKGSDIMSANEKEILQKRINKMPSIFRLFLRRGILSLGFIFMTLYIVLDIQPYKHVFYYLSFICFAFHLSFIIFLYRKKLDVCVEDYEEIYMKYPKKMKTEIMIIAVFMILQILIHFIFTKVLI